MRLIVLADGYPAPDRASGDLRFATMLRLLARDHVVVFAATRPAWQADALGDAEVARYRARLEGDGVRVVDDPYDALRGAPAGAVLCEFWNVARRWLAPIRRHQPDAPLAVDSVDVHFVRLARQARLTRRLSDWRRAFDTRRRELATYRASDLVIAVTEADERVLRRACRGVRTAVVTNVHALPVLAPAPAREPGTLVFVGGFAHPPNVDAMLWFGRDILPRIAREVPGVKLRVIGSGVPDEVEALAGPHIEVRGFVPETTPYLLASEVSIAPLRYGAGMKGKIGEALAAALPVVTTTTGVEGFGLTPGRDVLVADDAEGFARHVVALLRDPGLRARLGAAGRALVEARYGAGAVAGQLASLTSALSALAPRRLPFTTALRARVRAWARRAR